MNGEFGMPIAYLKTSARQKLKLILDGMHGYEAGYVRMIQLLGQQHA